MKTRRSSLLPDRESENAPAATKLRKVKKAAKKNAGRKIVVQPKVVIKLSRQRQAAGSQRATRSGSSQKPASRAALAATTAVEAAAGGRRQRAARRASAAAACQGDTNISDLSAETMHEIFLKLATNQAYCREILPLVCKRFRDLLQQPSPMWETLQINFLEKGAVVSSGVGQEGEALDAGAELGRRRLLRTAVEKWLRPRAQAVKRLLIMFSSMDPTHSFSTSGHGLRQLFGMLPGLQELHINSCSDIFHGCSFSDLAAMQRLQVLALTCISSKLAAEDLALLEQLKQLKSLTIHCQSQYEEANGACFSAFPEVLFKLKGLQELAFTSKGIMHIPTGITRLKALQALDVSGTNISFLPQNLWRCSELRHVRLNGTGIMLNMMHAWEPLVKLPKLETLELRDTKARSLPLGLTGLTGLTSLDLSENIFEHEVYQGEDALRCLLHMPALKRLALRRSQISTVPNVCCILRSLTHLDLSHNFLVDLPESLQLLHGLKELLVQGNSFPRIPEVLHKLAALEMADLSFCIYMEVATPIAAQAADGFKALRSLDLRKMLGVWKESSKRYLHQLDGALVAQGRPQGVLQF